MASSDGMNELNNFLEHEIYIDWRVTAFGCKYVALVKDYHYLKPSEIPSCILINLTESILNVVFSREKKSEPTKGFHYTRSHMLATMYKNSEVVA